MNAVNHWTPSVVVLHDCFPDCGNLGHHCSLCAAAEWPQTRTLVRNHT